MGWRSQLDATAPPSFLRRGIELRVWGHNAERFGIRTLGSGVGSLSLRVDAGFLLLGYSNPYTKLPQTLER